MNNTSNRRKHKKINEGIPKEEIKKLIEEESAEPIYNEGQIVGCVKRAHDIDVNLT